MLSQAPSLWRFRLQLLFNLIVDPVREFITTKLLPSGAISISIMLVFISMIFLTTSPQADPDRLLPSSIVLTLSNLGLFFWGWTCLIFSENSHPLNRDFNIAMVGGGISAASCISLVCLATISLAYTLSTLIYLVSFALFVLLALTAWTTVLEFKRENKRLRLLEHPRDFFPKSKPGLYRVHF